MKHLLITNLGVIKFGKISVEVPCRSAYVLVPAFPLKWCCEEGRVDVIQDVTAVKRMAVELIEVNRSPRSGQPPASSDWSENDDSFGSPNSPNMTAHLLKVRMASTCTCGMLG